jgi:predicted LPLAT superfamily acyltransferase
MSTASPPAEWRRRPERGSLPLLRLMAWVSLRIGRRSSRVLVRVIAAYFLAFGGRARRASREFLERSLGRKPTLAEQYRLFFAFAASLHDRVYLLKDRFELFDCDVQGTGLFDADGGAKGVLLMGAHLGSFEVLRACGRHISHRRVAMAMYEENARRINSVLAAIDPSATQDIVALGRAQSMLELARRLDEGAIVGVLADRTLGDEPVAMIDFLGRPAPFPTGPMRMAAALRQRVFFMAGIYRGGNRYEIRFEPLADFSAPGELSRDERQGRVEEAVVAYARCLERYARAAPDNWFNFYDFWSRPA